MYVVLCTDTGLYMARPEVVERVGCIASLRPHPIEWTDLDRATRFDTALAALAACPKGGGYRVLSLREAHRLESPNMTNEPIILEAT